jgi:hypothetical protein
MPPSSLSAPSTSKATSRRRLADRRCGSMRATAVILPGGAAAADAGSRAGVGIAH